MSGYFIYELDIFDEQGFYRYADEAREMLRRMGGQIVLSSEQVVPLEGGWEPRSIVMAKFETVEAAQSFYDCDAYQAMLALRKGSANSRGILVQSSIGDLPAAATDILASESTTAQRNTFAFDLTKGSNAFEACADLRIEEKILGLGKASSDEVAAKVLRARGSSGEGPLSFEINDHCMLYVVRGQANLTEAETGIRQVRTGTSVYLPPGCKWNLSGWSFDLELLMITARVKKDHGDATPFFDDERPDSFLQGPPGREYLSLRPLRLADRTDRQLEATVIRGRGAPSGGTGWHHHSNSEWVFILSGAAELGMQGTTNLTIRAGDSLTFPPGSVHAVPTFSEDYSLIAINAPADFKTFPSPSPNQT